MLSLMMKYVCQLILFSFFVQDSFASSLAGIIAKYPELRDNNVSIEILDTATGKSVYSKNPELALNPASALKILISATAFETLGLARTFKTTVKKSGSTLCLVGGGDPSLVQESLKELAKLTQQLLALNPGVLTELVVDETLFPAEKPFDQTFAADEDRAFTADIGSLSVNFNSIAVRAKATKIGEAADIILTPDIPEMKVKNKTVTASSGGKKDIGISINLTPNGKEYVVNVDGKVSNKEDFFTLYASIPSEPALVAGYIFRQALKLEGISIPTVAKKPCPVSATDVISWSSKPLANIVQDMNIYSNNFIAETLLRNVGETNDKTSGLSKVRQFLASRGLTAPTTVLDNASGLSRNNRISSSTLAKAFANSMNDFEFGPEFLTSMSINGRTGTMRNRMRGKPLQEPEDKSVIRAKSGTLKGVVSLVGRARTNNKDYVFSFLFNTFKYSTSELQGLENDMLRALLEIR